MPRIMTVEQGIALFAAEDKKEQDAIKLAHKQWAENEKDLKALDGLVIQLYDQAGDEGEYLPRIFFDGEAEELMGHFCMMCAFPVDRLAPGIWKATAKGVAMTMYLWASETVAYRMSDGARILMLQGLVTCDADIERTHSAKMRYEAKDSIL